MSYSTILADPPWRFNNRTVRGAPEEPCCQRYQTLTTQEISEINVDKFCNESCHLYLWVPNAMLPEGLMVMDSWGFSYKTNIVWRKIKKDGDIHKGGLGFYFRNATEMCLFGVKGKMRTLQPGRTQVNVIDYPPGPHSQKPIGMYEIIEACSPGPRLELFARNTRDGWDSWGDEVDKYGDRS